MTRLFLLSALALAGCATSQASLRRSEPVATYTTAKPLPELEACLAEGLSHLGGPSIVRRDDSSLLSFGSGGITSLMIEIAPRQATVRSGYPYFAAIRNRVEGCL